MVKKPNDSVEQLILEAAQTAYLNSAYGSSLAHQPQFLSNDYECGRKVFSTLESELSKCSSFAFSVAFITMGGIVPLLQVLKELELKGVPGRILTTDYLSFSEPRALEKLSSLSNIEVRLFETVSAGRREGFHTKGYFFEYEEGYCKAIIGSSNLTAAALAVNKEWNMQIVSTPQGQVVENLLDEFERLWSHAKPIDDVIDAYRALYEEKCEMIRRDPVVSMQQIKLEPNGMQLSFVAQLRKLVESGERRALLISATGTGKTYASAFAVRNLNLGRVLFVAHREQILRQARDSYRQVIGCSRTYGLLSGTSAELDCDLVFATMQTLSKEKNLEKIDPTRFGVVVIDEVHRAGAASYQKIIEYFEPQLFLGMTASPDRTDGFDIYGLFDNNIAYEIRLQRALEEDLLCPFHYFGITSLTIGGHSVDDDTELRDFSLIEREKLADYLIEKAEYYGHSGPRVKGLVFCRSNFEAGELARLFTLRGYRSLALSGGDSQEMRENAVERLSANKDEAVYGNRLDYVFTVDIFNEGVDIPCVNQVLMVRPTESPVVFVQQLGRGLRKAPDEGKDYVVILDFIGNYSNNYMIPLALSGDRSYNKDTIRKFVMEGARVIPGVSSIHFDEVARQMIFESINNTNVTLRFLKEKYRELKYKLGKTPCLVDFIEHGEIDPLLILNKKGSYQAFLMSCDNDYSETFSSQELEALRYLSAFVANGMRPHELLMLEKLLECGETSKEQIGHDLREYFLVDMSERDYSSARQVLTKRFANSQNDLNRYGGFDLVEFGEDGSILSSDCLEKMIARAPFKYAVLDLVDFGLRRYQSRYADSDDGMCLYEKYSRKDVCRLLGWEHDDSSTMYGYRIKHGTCPIFVTYDKKDDIASSTQYEDAFVDQRTFSWMTRSRLTLASDEVQKLIEADAQGLDVRLFVKKHDNEGSDFYYLGKVHPKRPVQKTILDDSGNVLGIVNFLLELEHPVREDIFEYFVG